MESSIKATFLYLALKEKKFYRQAIFSIYSCLYYIKKNNYENIKIIVYTDNVEYFKKKIGFDIVEFVEFNDNLQRLWFRKADINEKLNSVNIISFVKPKCIKDLLEKTNETVVFIDTDTFFVDDPIKMIEQIDKEHSLMWRREGLISDESRKNWNFLRETFANHEFKLNNNNCILPQELYMWNAGVIGISKDNTKLVDMVMDLSLQIYNLSKEKIIYQEQVMFSYILNEHTKLLSTTDFVYHYCYGDEKENINIFLKRIISRITDRKNKNLVLQEIYQVISQKEYQRSYMCFNREFKRYLNYIRSKITSVVKRLIIMHHCV